MYHWASAFTSCWDEAELERTTGGSGTLFYRVTPAFHAGTEGAVIGIALLSLLFLGDLLLLDSLLLPGFGFLALADGLATLG